MRALVVYGSKRGGTAGLAEMVVAALKRRGVEANAVRARDCSSVAGFDLVIVGGALYGNRWHRDAVRLVRGQRRSLASPPVWLFGSGPLGDEAATTAPQRRPVAGVARLMRTVDARGHRTFGARLASGFPASAMARTNSRDWRKPEEVDQWVAEIMNSFHGSNDQEVLK